MKNLFFVLLITLSISCKKEYTTLTGEWEYTITNKRANNVQYSAHMLLIQNENNKLTGMVAGRDSLKSGSMINGFSVILVHFYISQGDTSIYSYVGTVDSNFDKINGELSIDKIPDSYWVAKRK
jgi:hypothetical protein